MIGLCWTVVLAIFVVGSRAELSAPSISVTELVNSMSAASSSYTLSNEGVRMVYVNPFKCQQAATSLGTWVIDLGETETVNSFQVTVLDGTLPNSEEAIVVRVGDNNPPDAGASSNSLCAVVELNSTTSMVIFDCQQPMTGRYISVTRNDGGNMNVCAFSANLGQIPYPPANAPGPFVSIPADELLIPRTPDQAPVIPVVKAAPVPAPAETSPAAETTPASEEDPTALTPAPAPEMGETLPTLSESGSTNQFLTLTPALAPAPSPSNSPSMAPQAAASAAALPVFSALGSQSLAPTPAPGPVPAPAPSSSISTLPVFAAVNAPAESVSDLSIPVPAPAPVMAPTVSSTLPIFATQMTGLPAPVPAPAPSPVLAPSLSSTALPIFATQDAGTSAPVPAPAPSPVLAPSLSSTALPIFATQDAGTPAPVPAPAPVPVLAPAGGSTAIYLTLNTPAPAPAPVPAPQAYPATVFATLQTPVPAPGPAPVPAPEAEPSDIDTPSSPLLGSLEIAPTPSGSLVRPSFATQDPKQPGDAVPTANSATHGHSGSGLSGGDIAGIVIGCVVGVALIAGVALYLTRHRNFGSRVSSQV